MQTAERSARQRWVAVTLVGLLLVGGQVAQAEPGAVGHPEQWHAAWSRPQHVPTLSAFELPGGGRGPRAIVDQTVRVIVRVTGGGRSIRVHLANRYGGSPQPAGTTPAQVLGATVAIRQDGASLVPGSIQALTFGGDPGTTIEPGATAVSDAIDLPVSAGDDLAVSLHVESAPAPPSHASSFVTSFLTPTGSGDHVASVSGDAFTERTTATPFVTQVDVLAPRLKGTIVVTGDSKVDGTGSDVDQYNDLPSQLDERLRRSLPPGRQKTVVNHGIGGTTAAAGVCSLPVFGPSLDARIADESLDVPGLTHVIVFTGTNDLGFGCTATEIIAALTSIADQAHRAGVRVLISTITPRESYTAPQNAEREVVNAWIRSGDDCSGHCDRSLDFDAIVRDPDNPNRLNPELDSGDGFHPGGEGYRRLAESIPLDALR